MVILASGGMTKLGKLRMPLLVGLPFILLVATAVAVWDVADKYPQDPATRWAAIAAILTAAAFLVAVFGLPFGIYQLVVLESDLTRSRDLVRTINQFRVEASPWVKEFHFPADNAFTQAANLLDFESWVERVANFIGTNMDEAEEQSFRNAGLAKQIGPALEDKLLYLRDQLIPKVREGYW